MEWISKDVELPTGFWSKHEWHKHLSEDVLFCNDIAMFIGRWNRETWNWEIGAPADSQWVDDVTHWMPLPKNPNK